MAHCSIAQNDLQHTLIKAEYVKLLFNLHTLENGEAGEVTEVEEPMDETDERSQLRNGNGAALNGMLARR